VTTPVTIGESGQVEHDVDLPRLPRGELEVVVREREGDPIPAAGVMISGPMERDGVADDDGRFVVGDLLEGAYEVEVATIGYLSETVTTTVEADTRTVVTVELSPNDVAVLGDADGALTGFLQEQAIAAEERTWGDLAEDIGPYDVVFVNGGAPDEDTFAAVLDAADVAGANLIFTGTWGVDRGGIRLLEAYTDDVAVGTQGYRDGRVELTGLDPDHPLFDGLGTPSTPIVEDDGYYSALGAYVGHHLAGLTVGGDDLGLAVGYDFRGLDHVHLLLSVAAVSEVQGPGYGWSEETGQLVTNAVTWVRGAEQEAPAVPTLETVADRLVTTESIEVSGEASFRSTVTILRDGEELAVTEPDRAGVYSIEIELVEGENRLVATSTNHAGSEVSDPLTVWLDTTGPELAWTPEDGEGSFSATIEVAGTAVDEPAGVATVTVDGEPVDVDEDGAWSTEVFLDEGANDLVVVATDTLGNETVETRTVGHVPLGAEWEVTEAPAAAVNVRLHLTDVDGVPTEVDRAELDAIAEDGTVSGSTRMRWSEERYQAVLRRLPAGDHDLVARLSVDGWMVKVAGPTVTAR
jgi:hypothetical protein